MNIILMVCAVLFAALLDIVMGVSVVFALGEMLGESINEFQYLIGSALALFPDIDYGWQIVRGRNAKDDHHQYLMHRPLFGLVCAPLLGYALGGTFWALVAGILVLWHYVHDTEGFLGRGVAWLWPFSSWYYGICFSKMKIVRAHAWQYQAGGYGVRGEIYDVRDMYCYPTRQSVTELIASCFLLAWPSIVLFGIWGLTVPAALLATFLAFWAFAAYVRKRPAQKYKSVFCSCMECSK